VTTVLDPGELAALRVPDGTPRAVLTIMVAGRAVSADIAAKSLRRGQAAIREATRPDCRTAWGRIARTTLRHEARADAAGFEASRCCGSGRMAGHDQEGGTQIPAAQLATKIRTKGSQAPMMLRNIA
jgi:hypothetical protein